MGTLAVPDLNLPWENVADKAAALKQAEASRIQAGKQPLDPKTMMPRPAGARHRPRHQRCPHCCHRQQLFSTPDRKCAVPDRSDQPLRLARALLHVDRSPQARLPTSPQSHRRGWHLRNVAGLRSTRVTSCRGPALFIRMPKFHGAAPSVESTGWTRFKRQWQPCTGAAPRRPTQSSAPASPSSRLD